MSDQAVSSEVKSAPLWWVQVRGQAYGPYSFEQLAGFVAEGRVRAATPVSDRPESGWTEARLVGGLMPSPAPARAAPEQSNALEFANVFVFAEIRSGAWMAFMAAIESMGAMCELAPGLWLVRTRHSAGAMRNALSQTLERGDRFVVMDATRDRLAWYNLGPEVDVRISHVWNAHLKTEKK